MKTTKVPGEKIELNSKNSLPIRIEIQIGEMIDKDGNRISLSAEEMLAALRETFSKEDRHVAFVRFKNTKDDSTLDFLGHLLKIEIIEHVGAMH